MKFTDFHNSELAEASKTRNPTRDFLRNNPVSPDEMAKPVKQMSVPELATVSDEALDNAYHYGRSTPGNTFGWQANLKSAAYAKLTIDKGITDIEQISDAIHKGWNVTARAFVQNPDQFDDTEKLKAAGKLEAKLQQRAKLMNIEYAQLPDDEQEKDRVVARALLQAIKGQPGVAEGWKQTLRGFDPTIKARIRGKSQDQTNQGLDTIQHLADLDLTSDDMVSRAMKPNTYFRNAERYAKLANKGVAEGDILPFKIPADKVEGNYEQLNYRKNPADKYAVIDHTFNGKIILTTNKFAEAKKEAIEWAEYDDILTSVQNQQTGKNVLVVDGYAGAEKYMQEDVVEEVEQMFHVKTDQYGANKDVPLYTKTYSVRANSEQEAINTVIKIFGGTNHRIEQGVAETRIETIHGSAYTIDPNKYYVWAWDNAVVLYGEYTDENDAELNLSKIERRATKRLGPAVKGRFEVASGKMLLRQYGNEQGVAEAKADPLGAWIAHKNGTEARKFKTREGAKKYVASHAGFTVSSSEAFHDTYRKKKVQEVKKFRTTYGWAGGSKEPRSAHAKQVAAKRKEYNKGLGKFEPTDDMVGTAKIVRDIAMSDASPEHKKAAIDALNKKGVAEEYNPEYDDEAGMADNNLSTLRRAVDGLDDLIDTGDNLPEWCQEKIAVAKSMLVTVWNYMESEDDVMAERVEGGGHLKNKDDLRAKRKAIQDILMDPTMDADTLKRAQQAKLDLENQAEKIGVAEGEKWIQKAVNSKTKGNLHKALHVPQDETIPKSRIAQAIHSADPHLRHMAQFAKNVAKEDAGGMGTGSVATSMGAGNGFANGGPGTIKRRRK